MVPGEACPIVFEIVPDARRPAANSTARGGRVVLSGDVVQPVIHCLTVGWRFAFARNRIDQIPG
jgi:hypothetical protein